MARSKDFKAMAGVVLAALAAALLSVSCGGGAEDAASTDQRALSAAAAKPGNQQVCHYDKDTSTYSTLILGAQGAAAHVANHPDDRLGACVATCPCFDAATLRDAYASYWWAYQECPTLPPPYVLYLYADMEYTKPGPEFFVHTTELWCSGPTTNGRVAVNAAQAAECLRLLCGP